MIAKTAVLTLLTLQYVWSHPEHPIVNTPLGTIKGTTLTSRLGKDIFSFLGIKYAEPPVDELRFKPPVPIEKYEGTYDATKDGPICPQPVVKPIISEDCLALNVYTTKLPEGFLATGDKEAPGNNGLKDQVLVLKWVQKYIESFGGDPNSVTLLGYSSGSWSAILHMLSPMSKGLFHRAIAMSGSPLGIYPIPSEQVHLAKHQAHLLGCSDDSSEKLIQCLKTKPAKEIGDSLLGFREFGLDPILIWSPVVEPDVGQERFLTDDPIHLIKKGQILTKVPLIIGQTKDEFAANAFTVVNNETLTKAMNEHWEEVAPIAFIYERGTDHSIKVSKAIRKFYLSDKPVDKSQVENLAKIYTDALEGFPINRAAKLMVEHNKGPVYYYRFSFTGKYSHFYLPDTNNTVPHGAAHHDDLMYLFHIGFAFPQFTSKIHPAEDKMVNKLTTLVANFAKSSNPTPTTDPELDNVKWETFDLKDQKFLEIGDKLAMSQKMFDDRMKFWETLYPLDK
ncbi:unnamed protein product [Acanthoscelides obtectus]|uniref:Carboxylic ester hydrolase n=1 Tax=Acanthoscelides obtectus TaxID=200917 RepID=A0A9P0JQF5_ACAOB|nr:unnamed protein product [Acanthoscelides obtectus]CAK1661901.1 hypothetical protein AOBTE_LOCUS22864 [Acanthoscelides obtectus]